MERLTENLEKNFYKNVPNILHYAGIYVVGDLIVLVPFILIFFPIVFIVKGLWGLAVAWTFYMGLRHFIEIIYWLFQQFGEKNYRPGFPTKRFGNNDVYIIHQLLNTVYSVIYFTILIFLLAR